MDQSDYLTNLLGIDTGGVGQTRYEYTLPIFNKLLSQGLSEDQISGYDQGFGIFNQFPYKTKVNPQKDYAQYEVSPQAPVEEEEEKETEVDIDYSNVESGKKDLNSFDTISTQKYGTIRDNVPETLNISGVPLNDMTEQELMDYGKQKGYIGEDGNLMGPMQVSTEGVPPGLLSLSATALKSPIQGLNDKAYERFTTALQKKNMFLGNYGGEREDRGKTFADFSNAFKKQLKIANSFNSNLITQGTTGQIKIPGTFKYVNAVLNQYVPSGKDDNEVFYKTGSCGHYLENGKFQSAYGKVQAFGSMSDAIDTLKAAAQSGNSSAVPDKFDQEWVNKMNKAKTLDQNQKDTINESWDKIKKTESTNKANKAKKTEREKFKTATKKYQAEKKRQINIHKVEKTKTSANHPGLGYN